MEMRVLHVPRAFGLDRPDLFLCAARGGLEVVIASRTPWWRLPYKVISFWSLTAFL